MIKITGTLMYFGRTVKTRFYIFVIVLCIGFVRPVHPETRLKINTSIKPPFSTKSQTGFFDLLIKEVFTRLDIPFEIVRLPAERAMINVNTGESDGELPRIGGLSERYGNIVQVPEKLLDYSFVAFSQPEKITGVSFAEIRSRRIGMIIGWKIYEKNLVNFPEVVTVAHPGQLFALMDLNRIDIALYERYAGQYILQTGKFKGIHECDPPLAVKSMYLYLNEKHKDKVPLIARMLKRIKEEGGYQDLFDRTIGLYGRGP
ncbi:MAG: transporter substrate-binding domain-containing protein [Desulfobacterales bacterium]|nr:transporter substrate-binding domain-containing protein [Desulfobacterales bacterium]